jgi:hypothetical protein
VHAGIPASPASHCELSPVPAPSSPTWTGTGPAAHGTSPGPSGATAPVSPT